MFSKRNNSILVQIRANEVKSWDAKLRVEGLMTMTAGFPDTYGGKEKHEQSVCRY